MMNNNKVAGYLQLKFFLNAKNYSNRKLRERRLQMAANDDVRKKNFQKENQSY